jgi:hypothetical protein
MGNRRLSQGRLQQLVDNNLERMAPPSEFAIKRKLLHPDQDDSLGSTVTTSTTFTKEQSGRIVMINASSSGNLTMTLPTDCVHGENFTFLLTANSNAAAEVLIDAGSGVNIRGISTGVGNSAFVDMNAQTVGFADAEKRGAIIELVYTGNHWFILRAVSRVALITSFS